MLQCFQIWKLLLLICSSRLLVRLSRPSLADAVCLFVYVHTFVSAICSQLTDICPAFNLCQLAHKLSVVVLLFVAQIGFLISAVFVPHRNFRFFSQNSSGFLELIIVIVY